MIHKIFEPQEDLATFVKCYWTLEIPKEKAPKISTIVPDGCIKMIFHYADTYRHFNENGNSTLLARSFVIGQLTRPYEVQPTGKTGTFFVCFHPNGFLPFANFPIKEMENKAIPLEELFGKEGQDIGQYILNAESTQERISLIEAFLLNRLTSN